MHRLGGGGDSILRTGAAAGRRPTLQATSATPIVISGEESAAPRRVRSEATPMVEARRSMVQVHQGLACNPAKTPPTPPASVAGKGMEEEAAAAEAGRGVRQGSGLVLLLGRGHRGWGCGRCAGRKSEGPSRREDGEGGGGRTHAMMVAGRRRARTRGRRRGWCLAEEAGMETGWCRWLLLLLLVCLC